MEKDIKLKSYSEHLARMFKQIGESFEFNDSEIREALHLQKIKKSKELIGDPVEDSVSTVTERVQLMSMGWEYCLNINRQYTEQIRRVERSLKDKIDK
jgi:hypothetical protein